MRDFELEHHNRDDDGDHSITESFQTVLSHLFKIVRWYRLKMERGHPVRQRAWHAQLSFGELVRAVRAARSGGQDVRAPLPTLQLFSHRHESNGYSLAHVELNSVIAIIAAGSIEFDSGQCRHQLQRFKAGRFRFSLARCENRARNSLLRVLWM